MYGRNAEDLIIEVPRGTIIFDKDKKEVLADLDQLGSQALLAKGGKGGMGNAKFATSVHQAPRFAELGEPGEEEKSWQRFLDEWTTVEEALPEDLTELLAKAAYRLAHTYGVPGPGSDADLELGVAAAERFI